MFDFLRRKSKSAPPSDPIAAFWQFWAESRDAVARAIETRTLDKWVEPISKAVKAMHPQLAWELGKGERAQHYLAVSAEGDMERRVIAERWRSRAPAEDRVWEYRAAKPGGAFDVTLGFGGVDLDFASVRYGIERDEARRRLHTTLHHPQLARLEPEARKQASFIILDSALGEDDVERWIGTIDTSTEPLADTLTLRQLADAVTPWRAETEPTWSLLQAALPDGKTAVILANLTIKRVDHLLMEVHLEVEVGIEHGGMPDGAELDDLRQLEDELITSFGRDAVHIATETRPGSRTNHFHVAQQGPALARTEHWERAHPERRIRIEVRHDPRWEVLRRW
jgi:hypothetical protein